jgi:myo-inositol 2-dehydrogenase/D-chiro-inositol 1-dehydrogenase
MMEKKLNPTRRKFIKTTGATMLGATVGFNVLGKSTPHSWNADTLKVGLVGCGGRGTGAANQALNADSNVVLTAMADIFEDRLQESLTALKGEQPAEKLQIDEGHKFIGFDAYQRLLDSDVDVVLLATPPSFRPAHLEAALAAGKHVFCEKPVAVDAPGIRRVLEVARGYKEKNLALMSGFCWRHEYPKRATFDRINDGLIGEVMSLYNTYNTGGLWHRDRQPGWSDKEYKMRNWIYQNWLSGDHIVEQAVHSLDLMSWAIGDVMPVRAVGTGGRQSRTEAQYGNVFDHFAVTFEYENGARGFHLSRQQKGCSRDYGIEVRGTKGRCNINVWNKHQILYDGKEWNYEGEKNDMYQTEHNELFASIRNGDPFNDGERMAHSTMLAIWGRMVAYTGETLTWDEALNSEQKLGPYPEDFSWEIEFPEIPVAQPGITKFS